MNVARRLAVQLCEAMTAKGHLPALDVNPVLDGVSATCQTLDCAATYRAYPDEPLPSVWACSLHQHRNTRGNR